MSNLEFDERWLMLLWLVPALAAIGAHGIWQRRRALRLFASSALLPKLAPPVGWGRPLLRLGLVLLCLLALVAAIVDPRWGEREQRIVRRNIDLMVLLDVSKSMLARDIAPNRLERAKLSLRDDLLPVLAGDRIGLIAFAGLAALKCPLTNDYGFFRLALDDTSTQSVARGGTLIGDAIRRAVECFPDKLNTHKVILLITDGEDHESFPVAAASAVWEDRRIPIVSVALGDEREGARIPVESERGQRYLQYQGQTVWSRADFEDLRQIAAASDLGAFIPVGTRNFDLGAIYRDVVVPRLEQQERVESETVPLPSRYHGFALAALVLLVIDSVLGDVPRRGKHSAPTRANTAKVAA